MEDGMKRTLLAAAIRQLLLNHQLKNVESKPMTRRDELFDEYDSGLDAVDLPEDDSEAEELLCISCNGSGEGQYDGTRCSACKGSGIERHAPDF
jgi:hypothetical protein